MRGIIETTLGSSHSFSKLLPHDHFEHNPMQTPLPDRMKTPQLDLTGSNKQANPPEHSTPQQTNATQPRTRTSTPYLHLELTPPPPGIHQHPPPIKHHPLPPQQLSLLLRILPTRRLLPIALKPTNILLSRQLTTSPALKGIQTRNSPP